MRNDPHEAFAEVLHLLRTLRDQGWASSRTSKGHIRLERDGVVVLVPGKSPIDWTTMRNTLRPLVRYGYRWPP